MDGTTKWNPDDFDEHGYKFRKTFKATTIETYRTDAVMLRSYKPGCAGTVVKRGKIGGRPCRRSLNKLVFLLNNCDKPMQSMFTLTMRDVVSRLNSVDRHKKALKAFLQRSRRKGVGQFVWVREFQANGSIHWHVFTDLVVGKPGHVNKKLSRDWSFWFADYYAENGWCNGESHRLMVTPSKDGFVGCVRVEQLHGNQGGRYAGKEGSKRFQKIAPKRWVEDGGRWWYASGNVKCTPTGTKKIAGRYLDAAKVVINGVEHEIPYRVQFNRGQPPQPPSEA